MYKSVRERNEIEGGDLFERPANYRQKSLMLEDPLDNSDNIESGRARYRYA